jgi:hypothetical protein
MRMARIGGRRDGVCVGLLYPCRSRFGRRVDVIEDGALLLPLEGMQYPSVT